MTHTVDTLMALHDKAARDYSQAAYLVAHVSVNQADQIYQTARETKEALRTALTEAFAQPIKPLAQRVQDLVERLGGIEYLESRSSQPTAMPFVPWSKEAEMVESWVNKKIGGDK
jgi:hypothetical protein